MTSKIEVVPYNPLWPQYFKEVVPVLESILGDNCITIHHIGSTSVPGLVAKPVIDILPVVKDILLVDQVIPAMQTFGYVAKGEYGIPFRRFFQKEVNSSFPTYNVHVYEEDNPEIERHLLFANYLRSHIAAREAYGKLKEELAQQFPDDINAYIDGKYGFIQDIEQKSGFDGCRFVQVRSTFEWKHYHRIRKQQVFDSMSGVNYDPKHWTLTALNHYHFVFFEGVQIIGVLQIEFLDESRAVLRNMAIEEPFKNQGYGAKLLHLAERWILHQGRSIILLHAEMESESFYSSVGYTFMSFNDPTRDLDVKSIDMGKILS